MGKPRIGLLLGDPTGIGPEVAAKLLALPETAKQADILVIGDSRIYRNGAAIAGTAEAALEFLDHPHIAADCAMGKACGSGGEYALETLRLAVDTWRAGEIDAILYAPSISKP